MLTYVLIFLLISLLFFIERKELFECIEYIPYNGYPKWNIKKDTIFVSVASYRDPECSDTIKSIFEKAKHPERIYVGICQQNNKDSQEEICQIPEKYQNNINTYNLDYTEAKGPTYARYWCSTLWTGQEYYLQIDSHTQFEQDWDSNLIKMIEQLPEKSILSAYPPTKEQMNLEGFPIIDSCKIINKMPVFYAGFHNPKTDTPIISPKPFVAAGFMFLKSSFLYDVPFDPLLSGLFQGEEVLFSCRLFTNGYNIYAPNIKVCSHHYTRGGHLFFNEVAGNEECRASAEKKVLYLLGLEKSENVPLNFLMDYMKYSLGTERNINDFWNMSGIKIVNNEFTT